MTLETPSFLYRARSSRGELLYVGVTRNVQLRTGQHAATKSWWKEVADLNVEMFGTRAEALAAEAAAIRQERPVYNIVHVEPERRPKRRRASSPHGGPAAVSYRVIAEWEPGAWWVVTVPGVAGAITQARRLDKVCNGAAEVIEIQTGTPVDPNTLAVDFIVPGDAGDAAAEARRLRAENEAMRELVDEKTRVAIGLLSRQGLSLRDIGALTGVSFQRAQQIAKGAS